MRSYQRQCKRKSPSTTSASTSPLWGPSTRSTTRPRPRSSGRRSPQSYTSARDRHRPDGLRQDRRLPPPDPPAPHEAARGEDPRPRPLPHPRADRQDRNGRGSPGLERHLGGARSIAGMIKKLGSRISASISSED